MDKKKLIPSQAQPIQRITTGQLSNELAELTEEVLEITGIDSGVVPQYGPVIFPPCMCSYEGDEAE